jgi:hypothetical protein
MFCAISGSTPTEPVISPAGHLFEKSLVTKALKVRGSADRTSPPPARDRGRSVDFRAASRVSSRALPSGRFPTAFCLFRGARASSPPFR